jgi:membrane protease YdiL (CAAX protease family)
VITNDPSTPSLPTATGPSVSPDPLLTPIPASKVNPWWDVFVAFMAWLGSIVLLLFVPLLAIIPYFVYLTVKGGAPTPDSFAQDKTFLFLSIVSVIPAHLLTLLGVWLIVTRRGKRNFWPALKVSWPESWAAWQGVVVCFGIAVVLLSLGALVTKFLGGGKTDLDQLIESSFRARLATAILAVATAPLVEEIIYRGVLYPALQRLLGMGWAVVIVTVMFAGVHVPQYMNNIGVILVITALSVVLTLIRAKTDRLLPSIVIHLIFNGLQSLILIIEPFVEKPEKIETAPTIIFLSRFIRHLF